MPSNKTLNEKKKNEKKKNKQKRQGKKRPLLLYRKVKPFS